MKGKNLEVPETDRLYAETKLSRLDRMLDDRSEALVELSRENHRSPHTSHIVDVTLVIDGTPIRGSARAATHRAALDDVIDTLERRTVDAKEKPRVGAKSGPRSDPGASPTATDADHEPEPRQVVKVKRFAIEPMFEEDAVARMEELGHSFFVFVNAEGEHLAVLYRRRDGDYGLIEPQIGGLYTQADPRRPASRRQP